MRVEPDGSCRRHHEPTGTRLEGEDGDEGLAHLHERHGLAVEMIDERRAGRREHPAHQARDGAEEEERPVTETLRQGLGLARQLQA